VQLTAGAGVVDRSHPLKVIGDYPAQPGHHRGVFLGRALLAAVPMKPLNGLLGARVGHANLFLSFGGRCRQLQQTISSMAATGVLQKGQ